MLITIRIERRAIHLSDIQQSLATGAYARKALLPEFISQISESKYPYKYDQDLEIYETTLQRMIEKYSEQLILKPIEETKYWFAYSSGAFITPGYPPLFYSRTKDHKVSPNKSAVASIGEGVMGFIAQRLYKCRKLARPNHDFPDIVMENNDHTKTYLLESKATIATTDTKNDPKKVIKERISEELPRIAAYTSSCKRLDNRPVVGVLVGTAILTEMNYISYIMEVHV